MRKHGEDRRGTSGLHLARDFFHEAVRPIIAESNPDLRYSAALIGPGSEVLGYDDATSTDHHWGPRVMLFVPRALQPEDRERLHTTLAHKLPRSFAGYPTSFTEPDPDDHGTQLLDPDAAGPVNHRVEIMDLADWLAGYLGLEVDSPVRPADWLSLPQQKLLSIVSGELFHDGLPASEAGALASPSTAPTPSDTSGALATLRQALAWYPEDIWRFLLAAVWARVGQEEHLVGRAGSTGDELGARIIAARLVRDLMRLCFLYYRAYAPYPKWFGRAFAELPIAAELGPLLSDVVAAAEWETRDRALARAYRRVGLLHNESGLTEAIDPEPRPFFARGFSVLAIRGHADALLATIGEPWLTDLLRRSPIGNIDTITDNTDVLEDSLLRRAILGLYGER